MPKCTGKSVLWTSVKQCGQDIINGNKTPPHTFCLSMLIGAILTNPATNLPLLLDALWLHRTGKEIKICGVVLQGICSLDTKGVSGRMCVVKNILTKPLG